MKVKKYIKTFMSMAHSISTHSTANNCKVGSLLLDPTGTRVLCMGYNGTVSGTDNSCEDKGWICKECRWKSFTLDKPDECSHCGSTNLEGRMITRPTVVHAEQNVICFCAKNGIATEDCILVVTHSPCSECAKLIAQAGVKTVIYETLYKNDDKGISFLNKCGVKCYALSQVELEEIQFNNKENNKEVDSCR
ncbi:TPA: cytidine/deoxycytidylate deaminase family protein [Campylobacter jejuni]